jgi:SAM-dependent methyltransferase
MINPPDTLPVLKLLGEHHDFIDRIKNIAIMEDAAGHDSAWWADYQLDPSDPSTKIKFNITVYGKKNNIRTVNRRPNIRFVESNIGNTDAKPNSLDFIWANNCLQGSANPLETLKHWWSILKEDGMLCLSVPQNNYIDDLSRWQMTSYSGEYFNWNMLNLIQCLAVNGFDCRDGHFKQTRHDPYIWAAVYKSNVTPMDPNNTQWYDLKDAGLTPHSLDESIQRRGYVSYENLKVEWLDHSIYDLSIECLP